MKDSKTDVILKGLKHEAKDPKKTNTCSRCSSHDRERSFEFNQHILQKCHEAADGHWKCLRCVQNLTFETFDPAIQHVVQAHFCNKHGKLCKGICRAR